MRRKRKFNELFNTITYAAVLATIGILLFEAALWVVGYFGMVN